MDRYTKVVLTLIALGIWGSLLMNMAESGRGPISTAFAQSTAPTRVVIVGVQTSPNETPLNVVDVYAKTASQAAMQQARSQQQQQQQMQAPPAQTPGPH